MSVATPSVPAAVAEPVIQVREARREDWPALALFYAAEHPHRPRLLDERRWHWTFFERQAAKPLVHVLECGGGDRR
jgi:hypothetical protein